MCLTTKPLINGRLSAPLLQDLSDYPIAGLVDLPNDYRLGQIDFASIWPTSYVKSASALWK